MAVNMARTARAADCGSAAPSGAAPRTADLGESVMLKISLPASVRLTKTAWPHATRLRNLKARSKTAGESPATTDELKPQPLREGNGRAEALLHPNKKFFCPAFNHPCRN